MPPVLRFISAIIACGILGQWSLLVLVQMVLVQLILPTQFASGQDFVVHQTTGNRPVRRQGSILDWTGITLQLEQSGRTLDIDGSTVIAIEIQWPEDYQQGLDELARRNHAPAIPLLQNAAQQEQRPWAQNIIRSKILSAQLATENFSAAADTFFQIIATDPQSRFVPLCPLRWSGNDARMNQRATDWINSDEPIVRLLGASWLIGTNDTTRGVLEELARDIDPSVAGLAVGQLWNVRQTKMTAAELDVWQQKIETMPIAIRAGPHWAIASALARSGFADDAIANYMRIVILYPDQSLLAAPALYQAASLLNNTDRQTAAERLTNELKTKFPSTNWASR